MGEFTDLFQEAYIAGKRAAYEHAADIATHRFLRSLTLTPEAAKALFEALPDAIRAFAQPAPSQDS